MVQPQPPVPPIHGMAGESSQPDRKPEQVAQGHEPETLHHVRILENARAHHHSGNHAQRQRQSGGPPLPGGQRYQGPQGGVRHDVAEVAGGARDPYGAGPPQLVAPGLRPGFAAQVGLHHHGGELDAIAQFFDVPPDLVVVGQVVRDGFKAAHLAQGLGAKDHGGSEGELGLAQEARHQHAGREFGRDPQGLAARCPRLGFGAIEAGHQPDFGIAQRRGDGAEVSGRHHDVAIVHQQQRIPGALGQLRQHPDLGVRGGGGHHHNLDAPLGELAFQPPDILESRVVRIGDTEENLELGVILRGVREDGLVEARVPAMHGFEDGDRRISVVQAPRGHVPAPPQSGHDGEEVVNRRRHRRNGQPDHNDTNATPQITSDAPTQRSQFTCSFKTYLASTVSST